MDIKQLNEIHQTIESALTRIRVERKPNDMWTVRDFNDYRTPETSENFVKRFTTAELPADIMRKVSLLIVLDDSEQLDGVGYKYSNNIFYLDR